jgi:hypothetical protein
MDAQPGTQPGTQQSTDITSGLVLHTVGPVPGSARDQVRQLVNRLVDKAPGPLSYAKVKIKSDGDREPAERSLAQANIDVSGATLRAESVGESPSGALNTLAARLEEKLAYIGEPGTAPRQSNRPHFVDVDPEQRVIARHKTCSGIEHIDTDQALERLANLDYRFYLFTDTADDKTTMVADAGGEETTIQKIDGSFPDGSERPGVRAVVGPPPARTILDAMGELNETDRDHLFFRDLDGEEPSVLYRRYDGHYGLLVEAGMPG